MYIIESVLHRLSTNTCTHNPKIKHIIIIIIIIMKKTSVYIFLHPAHMKHPPKQNNMYKHWRLDFLSTQKKQIRFIYIIGREGVSGVLVCVCVCKKDDC
mmetsp:Transcript_28145/g.51451  ORF Transcript_28145/g.51451 Transcript_28145/m.51451 type:complete len:99 (-) Transcript_28145:50-346(-)